MQCQYITIPRGQLPRPHLLRTTGSGGWGPRFIATDDRPAGIVGTPGGCFIGTCGGRRATYGGSSAICGGLLGEGYWASAALWV
jgi:hypothetical protein